MATAVLMAAFVFILAARTGRAGVHVDPGVVDEMRRIEFAQIDYDDEATPYYGYIKGSIPVLISAPHGAKHYRAAEGAWRKEDAYTASLAIVLGRLTGAHVLYVKNKTTEDPNNDTDTQYKEFLKKTIKKNHIRFVLDLHGAAPGRSKVDIGIMDNASSLCSCPTFRGCLEDAFTGFEPKLFNQNFAAKGAGTVTFFCRNDLGIEAAQVEINANYRIVEGKTSGFKADPEKVRELIERLRDAIEAVNGRLRTTSS